MPRVDLVTQQSTTEKNTGACLWWRLGEPKDKLLLRHYLELPSPKGFGRAFYRASHILFYLGSSSYWQVKGGLILMQVSRPGSTQTLKQKE